MSVWASGATIVGTLLVAVAAYIYLRQLNTMNNTRKLQADLSLFAETHKVGNVRFERMLYGHFCENNFGLPLDGMDDDLRAYIVSTVDALSRVGVLLQNRFIDQSSASVRLLADRALRMWLILEEYVKRSRRRRGDPSWAVEMQLLASAALRQRLKNSRTGDFTIYHPDSTRSECKVYSRDSLHQKLQELETELKALGMEIR